MNHAPPSPFGSTRTRVSGNHAFLAPDGHVGTSLPGWTRSSGIVLISPQMGARFLQYLARMDEGGRAGPPLEQVERFLYVLEGGIRVRVEAEELELAPSGFVFLPAGTPHELEAPEGSLVNVYERRYVELPGTPFPRLVSGHAADVAGEAFLGDENLVMRKLLPDDASFDMAVNTMTFRPGTPLPFVETHFMEHGMLMLSGAGIYRLEDDWYPIQAGDTLWMGPYCPQWFGALGREDASYLLYKEANRDAFAFERES